MGLFFHFQICLVLSHYAVSSYNLTCPDQSQRRFRNYFCTDPAQPHYICLLNVLDNVNVESCSDDHFLTRRGRKKIRQPGITNADCTETRYQPITFTSEDFSECMYRKSFCSEEGQVIANDRSTGDQDRTCRCDYRAGYTYIVEPRNKCECVPSEEDCSCYKKLCPPGEELSRDYECTLKYGVPVTTCSAIAGAVKPDAGHNQTVSLKSMNKTDSSSMSNTSGGKSAAALFITLVLLTFFLVVLLVDFRPHVTEMTVKIDKNHIIYTDDINHVYYVIEGSTMSVDCKISSRIRVKSVKMVKVSPYMEKSNVTVKSVYNEKNKLDEISGIWQGESKQLNPSDTGEHRCILTNRMPLPLNNANVLSSKLEKNEILNYLTDLPLFHPETFNRITLRVHEIPSDIEIKKGYSGESIIFATAPKIKSTILSVQWIKAVHPSPDLKLQPLPHNGSPTYSIENITLGDSGDYICFMTTNERTVTNDQTVQSHRFRLKVIPSESSYDKIVQHKEDDTYVPISAVNIAMTKLRKHKMVVLKGREGSGKSKMCLEIASRSGDQHQYLPVMITSKKNIKEEFDNAKVLYILDQSDEMDADKFKELYKFVLERTRPPQAWTIIGCRSLYETEMDDELFLDCDSILSTDEKEKILMGYMMKHNIGIATSADCNFRQKKIFNNQDIQVTFDKNAIHEIITTEPLQGFPLMSKKFCEDRKKLHLGEKFFTDPPKEIVDRIVDLRETAIRKDDYDLFLMFCLLVYITESKCIDMKGIKAWYERFSQVQSVLGNLVYKFKSFKRYIHHKVEDSDEKTIQNAVDKMIGTYLKGKGGVYEFIHPDMKKATFLSSRYFATYGVVDCPLEYILEFIRSCKYSNNEEEMILKIDKDYTNIRNFCERLVREITIHSKKFKLNEKGMSKEYEKQDQVCKYIYNNFVKVEDEELCKKLFQLIDTIFCYRMEDEYTLQAWHVLSLMNHVTCNGMDPWIFSIHDISDGAIIFGLVLACEKRHNTNKQKRATFELLLKKLGNRLSSSNEDLMKKSQSFICLTVNDKTALQIDRYGNTVFHYLCLFSEDESCQILDTYIQCLNKRFLEFCLQMENKENIQPIHVAVALGKSKIIEKMDLIFDVMMKDDNKGKKTLKQIVQYVKDVHIERKDIPNLLDFDLKKNFDPEIGRCVTQGNTKDFKDTLKFFSDKSSKDGEACTIS